MKKLVFSVALLLAASIGFAQTEPFVADFESAQNAARGWTIEGNVSLDTKDAFGSKQSMQLSRTWDTVNTPTSFTSDAIKVSPGVWEIAVAAKSELDSADASYNGVVHLQQLDAAGKLVQSVTLVDFFGKRNWQAVKRRVTIPAEVSAIRFRAQLNKSVGQFWIDQVSAKFIGAAVQKDDRIKRLLFTGAELGHLLYPDKPREMLLTVAATKPLPPEQMTVSCVVKDYWGAEQSKPLTAALTAKGNDKAGWLIYEGKLDFSAAEVEIGRYYEIHGSIARKDDEPFTNYTSFAILPEAPANAFKPEQIPFTTRSWDNRIGDYVRLSHRLGLRIAGIWWRGTPDEPTADQLDLAKKLGMGVLVNSPAQGIEGRGKDHEQWLDEATLRKGVQNFLKKYGDVRPLIVNLGNEPHNSGDAVKVDVNAYRIIYDELKKADPAITVVGTSAGLREDYFKFGFGQWCDAYDFHVYGDAPSIRKIIEQGYPQMFKKYGFAKPIWSTELGLNSQGLARQAVATDLYKKTAGFFAAGGANMSWFGIMYPDPAGVQGDGSNAAHNVFDSRFAKYCPKLDAIAYYNAVNSILDKKFVAEKVYEKDAHAFLFRNAGEDTLQIVYKDKGRTDVFIPLPGVQQVEVIYIDGRRSALNAAGEGVTITINEDPMLLLYKGGEKSLPEKLGEPMARIVAPPIITPDQLSPIGIRSAKGAVSKQLITPPGWTSIPNDGNVIESYLVKPPVGSTVREANMALTILDATGQRRGELTLRPAVTGSVSLDVQPTIATKDNPPAVKLSIRNNSATKQDIAWEIVLQGEQKLAEGSYKSVQPTSAYFADTPNGTVTLEGNSGAEIVLPLVGADLVTVYRVRATVKDPTGRMIANERPISGFVGVPKSATAVKLDGVLDDAVWQRASVQRIDSAEAYLAFKHLKTGSWTGPQDLSADIKYAWDENNLYIAAAVVDDIAGAVTTKSLWQQDGLQFLVDPMRSSNQKVGKYDYAIGDRAAGPAAECYLAADPTVPMGNAPDIKVALHRAAPGSGNVTYEVAIPWKCIAPFKPAVGADLGLTIIVNDDDGHGRDSYMTWFGNASSKDVDKAGDLILME